MPHMVGTYLNVNHNLPPAESFNSLKIWLKMRVIASRLTFRYAYGDQCLNRFHRRYPQKVRHLDRMTLIRYPSNRNLAKFVNKSS